MFIKSRILTVLDCIPVVACLLCIRYLEKTFYPGHFSSGKAAAVTLILVFLMAFLSTSRPLRRSSVACFAGF